MYELWLAGLIPIRFHKGLWLVWKLLHWKQIFYHLGVGAHPCPVHDLIWVARATDPENEHGNQKNDCCFIRSGWGRGKGGQGSWLSWVECPCCLCSCKAVLPVCYDEEGSGHVHSGKCRKPRTRASPGWPRAACYHLVWARAGYFLDCSIGFWPLAPVSSALNPAVES